ncbi:MAG: hypothetical protein MUP85_02490 [Candidatus Lokiarchaeota archaeon]|nr:hypothetical protein [Candidatus Lokiarchaeota archaeon]
MLTKIKNWIAFLIAYILVVFLHEGLHAIVAFLFYEYNTNILHPYGFEVVFNTPPEQRNGFFWFFISGASNITTIILGYVFYIHRVNIIKIKNLFLKSVLFYLTIILLIVDPINLFIGPFIYGGDTIGIAKGLEMNELYIQVVGALLFLLNREFIARYILHFGIKTKRLLFKPWIFNT